MTSIPIFFVPLAGISLYNIGHQQKHVGEAELGHVSLSRNIVTLMAAIGLLSFLALIGMAIYFGIKLGATTALKFAGLALLAQFATGMIVSVSRLLKYAWAISLSGIVLLPLFVGTMLYVTITG